MNMSERKSQKDTNSAQKTETHIFLDGTEIKNVIWYEVKQEDSFTPAKVIFEAYIAEEFEVRYGLKKE